MFIYSNDANFTNENMKTKGKKIILTFQLVVADDDTTGVNANAVAERSFRHSASTLVLCRQRIEVHYRSHCGDMSPIKAGLGDVHSPR